MLKPPQIILGDCLEVMKRIPSESIDMCMTSPPYDNLRAYKGYSFDFKGVARELYRVVKSGGVVVWVVGDATQNGSETGTSFKQALFFKELGFNLHDTMLFHKINYIPLTHNRYEQAFEYMFCFSKGRPKTFTPIRVPCKSAGKRAAHAFYQSPTAEHCTSHAGPDSVVRPDKQASNIFGYVVGSEKIGHPAVYPLALATDQILSWTNSGDTVLDPFAGSGTTGVACKETGRNCILIEISVEYYQICRERVLGEPPISLLNIPKVECDPITLEIIENESTPGNRDVSELI
jgi:site-specific DNA-methyltransferase (adenine-specific)